MKKFKTNKLVRDGIIKMMQDNGIKVNYEVLSDENLIKELKIKLVEEANEVLETTSKKDLIEEIGDVLEVIESLIKFAQLDKEEILNIKNKKKEKRGGFDKKFKTHFVEIEENNINELEYYTTRPNQYPEIR
jgi:predicted house-cleaning noncanonical NTP pyrophosphatase (MazG superfamily)